MKIKKKERPMTKIKILLISWTRKFPLFELLKNLKLMLPVFLIICRTAQFNFFQPRNHSRPLQNIIFIILVLIPPSRPRNQKDQWKEKKWMIILVVSAVWPDGYIIIQYLSIYNSNNLPSSIKMPKLTQKFNKY